LNTFRAGYKLQVPRGQSAKTRVLYMYKANEKGTRRIWDPLETSSQESGEMGPIKGDPIKNRFNEKSEKGTHDCTKYKASPISAVSFDRAGPPGRCVNRVGLGRWASFGKLRPPF
jgi:hypothetical protein